MMSTALPDIASSEPSPNLNPLEWVGMQAIDLPVTLAEPGCQRTLHARVDAHVDLPDVHVKGIHMSRLYRLLDRLADGRPLSGPGLRDTLQAMIDSHRDCGSTRARLRLEFTMLVRRPALVTRDLGGWKSYPVRMEACLVAGAFMLRSQVRVGYSSTCPCSAALSRQLVAQGFLQAFGGRQVVSPADAASWLRHHATLATPHSQRSEALVSVDMPVATTDLGLLALVGRVEEALGTPLQTAVKREDEQAFAALNGRNLMYVEDAARRILAALHAYRDPHVHVRHLESLHPHDAVAWAASGDPAAGH